MVSVEAVQLGRFVRLLCVSSQLLLDKRCFASNANIDEYNACTIYTNRTCKSHTAIAILAPDHYSNQHKRQTQQQP